MIHLVTPSKLFFPPSNIADAAETGQYAESRGRIAPRRNINAHWHNTVRIPNKPMMMANPGADATAAAPTVNVPVSRPAESRIHFP
ncbi:hypothetical protein M707_26640 [Arthrobacter sp. AK-YN10]|nr:hypothetical protein M707_26640 [Arthrobacter sp. AK-YN10]